MRKNLPHQMKVLLLIRMSVVCKVSQSKFLSKDNMSTNLPRQIKVLLLIQIAIFCTVSQS